MKILKRTEQILSLQRGTKVGFLLGTGFVMLGLLFMIGCVLYGISNSVGLGWGLLLSPLAAWFIWFGLRRFLTNDRIITIYTFNKRLNKATIEFQGLRQSRAVEVPLHEIRAVEAKFLGAQYIYGAILIDFRLQLITHSGEVLLDQTSDLCEKRELESIARCLREFLVA
jgi:hypothetical protein